MTLRLASQSVVVLGGCETQVCHSGRLTQVIVGSGGLRAVVVKIVAFGSVTSYSTTVPNYCNMIPVSFALVLQNIQTDLGREKIFIFSSSGGTR
jgi:hypothetical protein